MYSSDEIITLDKIIQDEAKVSITDNNSHKKQVILTETQGINYSVTIRGIPHNTLIIRADIFESPKSFFQGQKGECKRCDYIMISHLDNQKVILLIEMKASKANEKEVIQQLKGGKCLVKYCQQIAEEFWGKIKFIDNYDYRFICLYNINLPKQPTRHKKQAQLHDSPENMLKIASPRALEFNKLIGNMW